MTEDRSEDPTTEHQSEAAADLQILFGKAFACQQAGDYAEAARLYRLVLARMPDNVNLLCNLGILYRDMKKPAMAMTPLQRACAIDPEKARAFRKSSEPSEKDVCTMCGDFCAVKRVRDLL